MSRIMWRLEQAAIVAAYGIAGAAALVAALACGTIMGIGFTHDPAATLATLAALF